MKPYEKAGRIVRLLAWIQAVVGVGVFAAILVPLIFGSVHKAPPAMFFVSFLAAAALTAFLLTLGKAIKEHKTWGRILGIAYGLLFLFGFPLGTIIGAYILWCLIKGWD